MDIAVEIALITGGASAIGGIVGAGSALLAEALRGRNERLRLRDEQKEEAIRQKDAELLAALSAVRLSSLKFIHDTSDVLQRYRTPNNINQAMSRVANLERLRQEYLDTAVAGEALWAILRSRSGRNAVEALRRALARAFNSIVNVPEEHPDVGALIEEVTRQLRVTSLTILPTQAGLDDYEYQMSLEVLSKDVRTVVHDPRSKTESQTAEPEHRTPTLDAPTRSDSDSTS